MSIAIPKSAKGIAVLVVVFVAVGIACPPLAVAALVLVPALMLVEAMKRGVARLFPEKYADDPAPSSATEHNAENLKPTTKPTFSGENENSPTNYSI